MDYATICRCVDTASPGLYQLGPWGGEAGQGHRMPPFFATLCLVVLDVTTASDSKMGRAEAGGGG